MFMERMLEIEDHEHPLAAANHIRMGRQEQRSIETFYRIPRPFMLAGALHNDGDLSDEEEVERLMRMQRRSRGLYISRMEELRDEYARPSDPRGGITKEFLDKLNFKEFPQWSETISKALFKED